MSGYLLYGSPGTGAVAVEMALTLLGEPYELVDAPDYRALEALAPANPMQQVPTLVLPDGEVMTESAAILITLSERHPQAGLAPGPGDPRRAAFLRWMTFVSSAIYSWYWLKDDPARLVADPEAHAALDAAIEDRIAACWAVMEGGVSPGRYILGDALTVLDLYVAVVSRFRPRRQRFSQVAPRLGEIVRRVDADPRLAALWADRYPFTAGWDRA